MNLRISLLAVAASLSLAACAPDTHGDLRDHVVINPPGVAPGRLTFAGIGVGSPSAEASAKFEDDRWFPRRFVADFGTQFDALFSGVHGGPTQSMALTYTGNPIAVRRVFDRWKEVFVRAGADCNDKVCFWDENGQVIAFVAIERWRWPPQVDVSIER